MITFLRWFGKFLRWTDERFPHLIKRRRSGEKKLRSRRGVVVPPGDSDSQRLGVARAFFHRLELYHCVDYLDRARGNAPGALAARSRHMLRRNATMDEWQALDREIGDRLVAMDTEGRARRIRDQFERGEVRLPDARENHRWYDQARALGDALHPRPDAEINTPPRRMSDAQIDEINRVVEAATQNGHTSVVRLILNHLQTHNLAMCYRRLLRDALDDQWWFEKHLPHIEREDRDRDQMRRGLFAEHDVADLSASAIFILWQQRRHMPNQEQEQNDDWRVMLAVYHDEMHRRVNPWNYPVPGCEVTP